MIIPEFLEVFVKVPDFIFYLAGSRLELLDPLFTDLDLNGDIMIFLGNIRKFLSLIFYLLIESFRFFRQFRITVTKIKISVFLFFYLFLELFLDIGRITHCILRIVDLTDEHCNVILLKCFISLMVLRCFFCLLLKRSDAFRQFIKNIVYPGKILFGGIELTLSFILTDFILNNTGSFLDDPSPVF